MGVDACARCSMPPRDAVPSVFTTAAVPAKTLDQLRVNTRTSGRKMFELYGVGKDGMVYRSPPPRRKEVDILSEVGRTSPAKVPLLIVSTRELPSD